MSEKVFWLFVCLHEGAVGKDCFDSFSSWEMKKAVNLLKSVFMAEIVGVCSGKDESVVWVILW